MRTKTQPIVVLVAILLTTLAISPVTASDCTLGVFGNANEDDTINMQDVTYTELIILEHRDQTELSDAKYDSKTNMQDVTQIELIILGKEKEITLLDAKSRIVTIKKPSRIVLGDVGSVYHFAEYYKEERWWSDKVVGIPHLMFVVKKTYQEFILGIPACVNSKYVIEAEILEEINPTVFIVSSVINEEEFNTLANDLNKLGIPLLVLNLRDTGTEKFVKRYIMDTE